MSISVLSSFNRNSNVIAISDCSFTSNTLDSSISLSTLSSGSKISSLRTRISEISISIKTSKITSSSRINLIGFFSKSISKTSLNYRNSNVLTVSTKGNLNICSSSSRINSLKCRICKSKRVLSGLSCSKISISSLV